MKETGFEPWECIFAEACDMACYQHDWRKSLHLFELAIANSQGEATYYWWYTALLAAQGRLQEAITILDSAVRHFSRITNIATRTDLALLQIIAGRFDDAEETLSASLDFTPARNPLIVSSFAILYEAQDRLADGVKPIVEWFQQAGQAGYSPLSADEFVRRRDGHFLLHGMLARTDCGPIGSDERCLRMREHPSCE